MGCVILEKFTEIGGSIGKGGETTALDSRGPVKKVTRETGTLGGAWADSVPYLGNWGTDKSRF